MAGFQFRLQILLDRKRERREHAEEALREREADLARERRTMSELREELARAEALYCAKRVERASGKADSGPRLACRTGRLMGLQVDMQAGHAGVLSQELFVEEAEVAVEAARAELDGVRRAVEQLEKHRERAEKAYLAELAYREELEMDEIGNGMYLSRRRQP